MYTSDQKRYLADHLWAVHLVDRSAFEDQCLTKDWLRDTRSPKHIERRAAPVGECDLNGRLYFGFESAEAPSVDRVVGLPPVRPEPVPVHISEVEHGI